MGEITTNKPWVTGPKEILTHAIHLLSNESDINRRLAMIAVDNAVELLIKTYLGLPERVTGISIPRKEKEQMNFSFPNLLDGLEEYGGAAVNGIDLAEIEWFHRLRNKLYHEESALTIGREKVVMYAEIAKLLFFNLFKIDLNIPISGIDKIFSEFLEVWSIFLSESNKIIFKLSSLKIFDLTNADGIDTLSQMNLIDSNITTRLKKYEEIRLKISYQSLDYLELLNESMIIDLKNIVEIIQSNSIAIYKKFSFALADIDDYYQAEKTLQLKQREIKHSMDQLKSQIDLIVQNRTLEKSDNEVSNFCPVCNSKLSKEKEDMLLKQYQERGRELGNLYRSNQARLLDVARNLQNIENGFHS